MKAKFVNESDVWGHDDEDHGPLSHWLEDWSSLEEEPVNGVYNQNILPEDAIEELFVTYVQERDPNLKVEVVPDPQVQGTFAVRLTRSGYRKKPETIDLLWNRGEYDEVEFETWPPKSGNLKFF